MTRQRMIVRQNCMNRAVDLLIAEIGDKEIPISIIKELTNKLEEFVWEHDKNADTQLNPETGEVEKKLILEM